MPRPPKSQGGAEVTRQAIVDASFRLFSTRGFNASSMRDIAAEAGITAGSIYNHFADKEEIFTAVMLAHHPLVRVLPLLSESQGQTTEALIRDAAAKLVAEIDRNPGIFNLMAIELVELEGRNFQSMVGEMMPHVQDFLRRVYASGAKIRPQDPITFFRAFAGMLLGYGLTRVTFTSAGMPEAASASLDEFIDIFLRGVLEE